MRRNSKRAINYYITTTTMSHARLRNAVIVGGWPTRTMTAPGRQGVGNGNGALIGRMAGTSDKPAAATVSSMPMLLQPVIPCRGMAASTATVAGGGGGGGVMPCDKVLTEENVFVNLRKMEYAVRGPLLIRALEIEKELQKVRKVWVVVLTTQCNGNFVAS